MTVITEADLDRGAQYLAARLTHMVDVLEDHEKNPPKQGPMIPAGFKRCSTCRKMKPLESFYRLQRSRDHRLGRCKSCFLTKRGDALRERGGVGLGRSAPLAERMGL